MSEISRELQEQQNKDVGQVIKKLFGDVPVIDAKQVNDETRRMLERDAIKQLNAQLDALKR